MSEFNLLEATRAVFASALPTHEKIVALAILNHWSRNSSEPFPSIERLSDFTSLSRWSVMRAIQGLEKVGAIRANRRHGGKSSYTIDGLTSVPQRPVANSHQLPIATPPVADSHQNQWLLATRSSPSIDPVKGSISSAARKRTTRGSQKKEPEQPSADSHQLKIHYVEEYKKHRGSGQEPEFENWSRVMLAFGKLCKRKGGLAGAKAIVSNALANDFCQRINPWELVDDANKHLKPPKNQRQGVSTQTTGTDEAKAKTWGRDGARALGVE